MRASPVRKSPEPAIPSATPVTIGPIRTRGIRKITALTSLKRRELASPAVAVVTTLDRTMQLSTPRTAPTRAPIAAGRLRDQVPTVPSATRVVAVPGMPISPPRASPVSSWGIGTAKVVNRAGSSVISAAAAATGTTAQPSSAAAPPSTTTVCARPASCPRRNRSPAMASPTSPSAYRTPMPRPTSCQGLRRTPLRSRVSLSLRRCATIPALPCGCGRRPAGRSGLRGTRPRGPLRRYRRRAAVRRRRRRRGRTSAGPGP